MLLFSNQTQRSQPQAENGRETCSIANANKMSENWLGCLLPNHNEQSQNESSIDR